MDALRYQNMKHYAAIIAKEVEDWVAEWGDEGELDFLDEFIRLTLHTACHCLLGPDFRYQMTEEFKQLYHALEKGLQAIAFVDPYLQQPVFEARDKARARLQELIDTLRQTLATHAIAAPLMVVGAAWHPGGQLPPRAVLPDERPAVARRPRRRRGLPRARATSAAEPGAGGAAPKGGA